MPHFIYSNCDNLFRLVSNLDRLFVQISIKIKIWAQLPINNYKQRISSPSIMNRSTPTSKPSIHSSKILIPSREVLIKSSRTHLSRKKSESHCSWPEQFQNVNLKLLLNFERYLRQQGQHLERQQQSSRRSCDLS